MTTALHACNLFVFRRYRKIAQSEYWFCGVCLPVSLTVSTVPLTSTAQNLMEFDI